MSDDNAGALRQLVKNRDYARREACCPDSGANRSKARRQGTSSPLCNGYSQKMLKKEMQPRIAERTLGG
jgi:hypothetical protein